VRAIVTGGAGFIGSHVADALISRGDEVHVVDDLSRGARGHVPAGASFLERDIRESLADVFDAVRPEVCFHLAAQADVRVSVARPDHDADVNVVGTIRLLEQARRTSTQLVFTSTGGAIYGECERPAREDDPREPLAPYGTSKLAGEEYLAMYNRLHGTQHVSLRLANIYGPRQNAALEGGVVAIFLERMASGEQTVIFGDGRQTRDFAYVGDVARALLAAAGTGGGVYNIGTGVETSVLELHELCRRVSGVDAEPEFAAPRLGELRRSFLDPALAARELGWRPERELESGLAETWQSLARR
jgi:UDP-glucose 4-epimerase